MTTTLREAWQRRIAASDYETHMARAGQAGPNAHAVLEAIRRLDLPNGSRVLFAGSGPGQMFDYIAPGELAGLELTFSDLSEEYLSRIRERLSATPELRFDTVVDDLEDSRIEGEFELVVVVLVLEHMDWRAGVASIARLARRHAMVIVQENPADSHELLTVNQPMVGTMGVLREAKPQRLSKGEVVAEFERNGFRMRDESATDVPNGKRMIRLMLESETC